MKDLIFETDNNYGIPVLLPQYPRGGVELPMTPWSAGRKNTPRTLHFYIDDYRFTALWRQPDQVVERDPAAIVELNYSLTQETPLALGLVLLYQKRWLSRYYQMYDIGVYVDLYVSPKWEQYNLLGIPDGYNAFATRGCAADPRGIERALETAKHISHRDRPNLIVYGGGRMIEEICTQHALIYIEDYMTEKRKNK